MTETKISNKLNLEPYKFDDLKKDIKSDTGGFISGFRPIDEKILIPNGALTIIAGRPGQGKTTFLMNFILNVIEKYPEATFAYFSYEEGRNRLAIKMISILSNHALCGNQFQELSKYIFEDKSDNLNINQGIEKFKQYTELEQSRLLLFSEVLTVESLVENIRMIKEKYSSLKAVFIDYVQKIPTTRHEKSIRETMLIVTQELRKWAQELELSLIVGAQMNRGVDIDEPKLENLKESGSIEEDANLIISINQSKSSKTSKGDKTPMQINILKNRDGISDSKIDGIIFYPNTLKIQ